MTVETANIRFIVGSRQILAVPRRLETVTYSLDHLLEGRPMVFPGAPGEGVQGMRILSAPVSHFGDIVARHPGNIVGGYHSYRRHYIDMCGSFDDYMAGFSGKTRSTLRRKRRKLEEHCSGVLDIREYRGAAGIGAFLEYALPLSRMTYQARLLNAGLPEDEAGRAAMIARAGKDEVRAYLLFVDGKPASYLYLPVSDGIVIYEYLGYDPALAAYSPGTVLQLEALERLFAEGRYRYFDFTEGEGAHKSLFGTASVGACSFFLLKRDIANLALMGSLSAFDRSIGALRGLAGRCGLDRTLRSMLRG
ncbi:MAG: GNAT family N-acetyltransferase [Novosphingobium sp.]